ncbi:Hypothetical protein, putative [Bodo saltans]|uniref:Uncharacterized protein n=1 Tax=Bodo saltans TaxID=75058 RepID=A0A0S4J4G0_BODSA|nr:Hypothetical protein, putative [Bodo saltans]|eukprot:CUG79006.1 Hypothetical protein, putative [Bodo saltans]
MSDSDTPIRVRASRGRGRPPTPPPHGNHRIPTEAIPWPVVERRLARCCPGDVVYVTWRYPGERQHRRWNGTVGEAGSMRWAPNLPQFCGPLAVEQWPTTADKDDAEVVSFDAISREDDAPPALPVQQNRPRRDRPDPVHIERHRRARYSSSSDEHDTRRSRRRIEKRDSNRRVYDSASEDDSHFDSSDVSDSKEKGLILQSRVAKARQQCQLRALDLTNLQDSIFVPSNIGAADTFLYGHNIVQIVQNGTSIASAMGQLKQALEPLYAQHLTTTNVAAIEVVMNLIELNLNLVMMLTNEGMCKNSIKTAALLNLQGSIYAAVMQAAISRGHQCMLAVKNEAQQQLCRKMFDMRALSAKFDVPKPDTRENHGYRKKQQPKAPKRKVEKAVSKSSGFRGKKK